jgi:hypothetical protein
MATPSTSPPTTPQPSLTGSLANLTPHQVAEICELVEARCYEDTVGTLPAEFVTRYDVRLGRFGPAAAMAMRRIDVPMFNRTIGLGLAEPITDETIDQLYALYEGAAVRFMVQVSPTALTDELHTLLERRGLPRQDNWVNLIRGDEAPPEIRTDLRVEQIGPEQAEAFGEILCTAFELPREYGAVFSAPIGRPDWRHYLGFDGETPLAAGSLYVHGEVGYLAGAGTLPAARRRGGQSAIMVRRIREALALGCHWLVTETFLDTLEHPNPSLHNMLRTGFQVAYERPNYIYFPPPSSGTPLPPARRNACRSPRGQVVVWT